MSRLTVLIGGGSGFVGSSLRKSLVNRGHTVKVISRTQRGDITWDQIRNDGIPPCDAIVNLAGTHVMDKKWTPKRKQEIIDSRVLPTKLLVQKMKEMSNPPKVFVSGSAVGLYPTSKMATYFETYSGNPAPNFAGEVVHKWEECSQPLEGGNIRRVLIRLGVVLGKEGVLAKMKMPLGLAYVGKIGDGEQYFPWIHVDDAANMITWVIENENIRGPVNVVAQESVTNAQFADTLQKVFKRPAVPFPKKVFDLMFGESAVMLTEGKRVVPGVAQKVGFPYKYPNLWSALSNI